MNFVKAENATGTAIMRVKINGKIEHIEENITIEKFLAQNNTVSGIFVVELNKEIVNKNNYPHTLLKEGDSLEIVTFCAGG